MRAAFFDVDGTLTETRVWNGLMEYFKVHRKRLVINPVFQVVHKGLYLLHRMGLVSQVTFREVWAKDLSWYLKGYTLEQAAEIWDWVVEERIQNQWRPETYARLQQHHQAGEPIFLVSGGPEGLLERVAKEIGADYAVGTAHIVKNGVYTGKGPKDACQGVKKVSLVKQRIAALGLQIDFADSYAYADSLGDLDLLEMVGHPVAVYPDPSLKPIAEQRGWEIIEG